jgi:tetratricopeptide (TPR) repeat protein
MTYFKRKKKEMKQIIALLDIFKERLFSNTYQLQRIVVLTAIILGVLVSFGSYYYYDRYYRPQPKSADVMLSEAEQAVRDDPQSADKRLALAEAYMINRHWDEAIVQANDVLAAYPDNQHAWLVVGVSNANNGKPADAIEPLTKFVDARKDEDMPGLDKQLQAAAYYLGDSYLQLGKPQEAIAPLEMSVNWAETDADSMYKLGMAYLGVQQYDKAVNMFQGATTFVPNYLEAYDGMAAAYDAMKQPELVAYARGMAAYSKKDYTTARDLLLQSAQAKPDFAPTFAGLGRVYEALNDLPNAKASYETALKLDINNFTASNGLQRVEALMKK